MKSTWKRLLEVEKMTEEWVVQGYREDEWKDMSTGWRDGEPSKTQALHLFKGVKDKYNSARLIEKSDKSTKVIWEDKSLLDQEIPIQSVSD